MRFIFILFLISFQQWVFGQTASPSLRLAVKANVYNHFSAFISNMNQEKGDREKFLSLFENENVNFIDDELSLINHNYAGNIPIGDFQEKVTNRTTADLSDEDWCGMPYFVGEPIFNEGDSTGEIDIIIKRVIQNIKDRPFPLTDTQILNVKYNFKKVETKTDEDKVITSFQFRVINVKLHSTYKKPHYVEIKNTFNFSSFGKSSNSTANIAPDSIKINGMLVTRQIDFFNTKEEKWDTESNKLSIVSYKDNISYNQEQRLNENLIFESFQFNINKKLGELGITIFSNGGSGLSVNTGRFLNGPFSQANQNIRQNGLSLDFHFPFLEKAIRKLQKKNIAPRTGNLSFFNLTLGYVHTGTFLGFNDIYDNQARIDDYGNNYQRIAKYKSYTERQKESAALLAIGLEKRYSFSKYKSENFLKLGAYINGTFPLIVKSTSNTMVNYTGYYPDYFNIKLSENGIMDFGDYTFTKHSASNDLSQISIAAKGYLGVGFKFKKFIIQPQLYYWHQINKPASDKDNSSIGVNYGDFSSVLDLNPISIRRLIGLELGFFILL
jgi:hypothetical protein